ncbi:hypothetical protein CDV31_017144 [Fusarium ambrosium]|uniref:Uncharacterized protein n=1 Tax=Fusarium ambrosium TaxID=131363 RepID=A0A428RRR7_9HYPO|nr:hypothetical protein CDV31_017144 [Fusarium ambrosium]
MSGKMGHMEIAAHQATQTLYFFNTTDKFQLHLTSEVMRRFVLRRDKSGYMQIESEITYYELCLKGLRNQSS